MCFNDDVCEEDAVVPPRDGVVVSCVDVVIAQSVTLGEDAKPGGVMGAVVEHVSLGCVAECSFHLLDAALEPNFVIRADEAVDGVYGCIGHREMHVVADPLIVRVSGCNCFYGGVECIEDEACAERGCPEIRDLGCGCRHLYSL